MKHYLYILFIKFIRLLPARTLVHTIIKKSRFLTNKLYKELKLEMVPLKWNYVLCPLSKSMVFENNLNKFIN